MNEDKYHSGDYTTKVPYKMLKALYDAGLLNPDSIVQIDTIIAFEQPELDDEVELPIYCFPKTIKVKWGADIKACYGSAKE